jgi:hypothetical protein
VPRQEWRASASTATTAVPPNAPLPAEPSRLAVVAATDESDHSPFIEVSVVTPTIAMRAPFFRRWPAVMVATIGVALVPPVMRMPRAADEMVPRLTCFMDICSSPLAETAPAVPQKDAGSAAAPALRSPGR